MGRVACLPRRPVGRGLLDDELAYLAEIEIVELLALVGYGRTTPPYGHHVGDGRKGAVGGGVSGAIDDECRGERGIVGGCRVKDVATVIVAFADFVAQSVCNLVIGLIFDVYHRSLLVISGLQKYGSSVIFIYTIFDFPKQNLYLCAVLKFNE